MPDDAALRDWIEAALTSERSAPVRVRQVARQPVNESASHRLERIDAITDDGTSFDFALKHVGPAGLLDAAQRTRPDLAGDSRREGQIYRLLHDVGVNGVPRLLAEHHDPSGDGSWLLLEWVEGTLLWRLADPDAWLATARWAARLPGRFRVNNAP